MQLFPLHYKLHNNTDHLAIIMKGISPLFKGCFKNKIKIKKKVLNQGQLQKQIFLSQISNDFGTFFIYTFALNA